MAAKTYLKTALTISLFLTVLAFAGTAHAKIIYVDDDGPADFDNIQAAIDAAVDGDIIVVGPGIYTGDGNRDIDFLGKAIIVRSLNGPETCIINCEGTESESHRGFYFHSGEGPDSLLSGLTITNGYAPKRQIGNYIRMLGGAIYCDYSSPVITNCIFRENISGWKGGAIMSSGSKPKIINCLFQNNVAQWGGGLHTSGVYGSSQGPIMTNCTFVDNFANNRFGGGGVYCDSTGKTTLTNCILWGNTYQGGGGYIAQVHLPNPVVSYCCIGGIFGSAPLLAPDGYHLLAGSPCIDAGDPDYIAEPDEKDLDGKPRIIGGRIDMGAYEYQPRILYVDDDAAGANNGSSWADAYNFLQDALATAYSGDEIHVAKGTYKPDQGVGITPGDRTATFQLINGVTLKGGYAGYGTPDPNAYDIELYETILNGDLDGNDIEVNDPLDLLTEPTRTENSYHAVTGSRTDHTAVLDGFTITGGNANILSQEKNRKGGGMYNYSGSPMLTNCTFQVNSASDEGGGMYNRESSPTMKNCTFSVNAAARGGAMINVFWSNPALTKCIFSYNSTKGGGGAIFNEDSSSVMIDCTITDNSAKYSGGGIYCESGSDKLINCTFSNNLAFNNGGAIYNDNSSSTLTNCALRENCAYHAGGGMYNYASTSNLLNCIVRSNSAVWGGGIYNRDWSNTTSVNCTFAGNSARNGKALACDSYRQWHLSNLLLTNCILWDGGNEIWNNDNSTITITYSDVQGGWAGEGNIDTDPCFVEPGYWDANGLWVEGDYHLLPDSPCINAGEPNYVAEPNETDLEGNPRVMGGRIDMGAYESPVFAQARILPRTINLASKGNWINCYIWLPDEYNVADIDPNSIFLEDEIKPDEFSVDEQQQVAMASFTREDVQPILEVGDINLKIAGQLTDTTYFEATDTIKVIDKAGKN